MGKRILKEKISEISIRTCDLCSCALEPSPGSNATEDGYPICWGFSLRLEQWAYTHDDQVENFLSKNPQFSDGDIKSVFHKGIKLVICPSCVTRLLTEWEAKEADETKVKTESASKA